MMIDYSGSPTSKLYSQNSEISAPKVECIIGASFTPILEALITLNTNFQGLNPSQKDELIRAIKNSI